MTSLHPAPPRHVHATPSLRIAVLGTRGVPAGLSGVEAAVEEVGRRLVRQGHEVTVYGRAAARRTSPQEHLGMRLVTVPAPRAAAIERVGHTAVSTGHLLATRRRHHAAIVFGLENAPLVPLLRSAGVGVALHVGGQGHRAPTRLARLAERIAVREADALIADTRAVQEHYADEFGFPAELIGHGATIVRNAPSDLTERLGLVPGNFHLLVAGAGSPGLETVVEGYHRSAAALPLVVVAEEHADTVVRAAERDARIRLLVGGRDQRLLDQLHAHALSAVRGGAGGGTDLALLRAMGAGTAIIGRDAAAVREVVGTAGLYFSSAAQLAAQLEEVERYPFRFRDIGELMQERARRRFDWNAVTEAYEALAARLARGSTTRGISSGRRRVPVAPATAPAGADRG